VSRLPLVLGLALLLVVPPTAAETTTEQEHAIVPALATPHVSDTHRFAVDLDPGGQVTVTLAWEGPAPTDLDLGVSAPGAVCVVTDVECVAGQATGTAAAAACQHGTEGKDVNVQSRTEQVAFEAHVGGTWTLNVMASSAVPGELVPYEIAVTTSEDGADTLRGPEGTTFIRHDSHCRTPAILPTG
jgi:hypothetical protein